jgi:hypothetical protein
VYRHCHRLPSIGRGLLAIIHLEKIQQEVNVLRHNTNRISDGPETSSADGDDKECAAGERVGSITRHEMYAQCNALTRN